MKCRVYVTRNGQLLFYCEGLGVVFVPRMLSDELSDDYSWLCTWEVDVDLYRCPDDVVEDILKAYGELSLETFCRAYPNAGPCRKRVRGGRVSTSP